MSTRPEDSPTAWFAVLERARLTRDHGLAERARQQLARLGVAVTFSESSDSAKEFADRLKGGRADD